MLYFYYFGTEDKLPCPEFGYIYLPMLLSLSEMISLAF